MGETDENDVGLPLNERVSALLYEFLQEQGQGGMVNGFYLVYDYMDNDGIEKWSFTAAPAQKLMTSLGLLSWANHVANFETVSSLNEIVEGGGL